MGLGICGWFGAVRSLFLRVVRWDSGLFPGWVSGLFSCLVAEDSGAGLSSGRGLVFFLVAEDSGDVRFRAEAPGLVGLGRATGSWEFTMGYWFVHGTVLVCGSLGSIQGWHCDGVFWFGVCCWNWSVGVFLFFFSF